MNKNFIRALSFLFPNRVADLAYKRLTHPQSAEMREHEKAVLNSSSQQMVDFKGFKISTYRWGEGEKKVLLIHGWEGHAGNFSELIPVLLTNGFTVYAFDAPSHGLSSRGPTSFVGFSEVVEFLIEQYGVSKLVSHSFGGVTTVFALRRRPDLRMEKYVLLTTPDRFSERIQNVADRTGISEKAKQILIGRLEREYGEKVETMNISDFVREVEVEESLIIHDIHDRIIPIRQSRNVHRKWKASQMREIEGTGHFKILRTDWVIDEVVAFLN